MQKYVKTPIRATIETHGCKLNFSDSIDIAKSFSSAGFEITTKGAVKTDVYILNSCTVTSTADAKARHALSSARRKYPNAIIVASGCYPQRDRKIVEQLEYVDLVVDNSNKHKILENVLAKLENVPSYLNKSIHTQPDNTALLGRVRGFVKIQRGCDQVCAYCIVPKVRGRETSIEPNVILQQVKWFVENGCSEIVFTGTQLGSYGKDLDPSWTLSRLIEFTLIKTDVQRIRVSSLQPQEIDNDLLNLWSEGKQSRLCRHFHIPLQSGSDAVLKRMRRKYSVSTFLKAVEKVRTTIPDCAITTDIISGFPGETYIDHKESLKIVNTVMFSACHVFPYSIRPGTSAAHFSEHIPYKEKKGRSLELIEISKEHARKYKLGLLGKVYPVLWEGERGLSGLSDNYVKVRFSAKPKHASNSRAGAGTGLIENVQFIKLAEDEIVECENR